MAVSYSVASHPGVRRQNNEDSCCVRPDLGLFVVADGVGGYAAGEVASRAAVEAIQQAIGETIGRSEGSQWPFDYQPALGVDGNRLNWAFHLANNRIRAEAEAGHGRQGMATTVAAVLLESDAGGIRQPVRGATIAHIGDSRIYRYREGRLDRLTRDHSWVEEQVQAGLITNRDARVHPRRNLLTRALTGGMDPTAELGWVPMAPGDRLLLCSDGLYSVLSDEEIAGIVAKDVESADQAASDTTLPSVVLSGDGPGADGRADDDEADETLADATLADATIAQATLPAVAVAPESICDALVHAANLAGGPDNITVILVRL